MSRINRRKQSKKDEKNETDETDEENDILKDKIRRQKKILREKIDRARKKAYYDGDPEEVEKTEKMVKDILAKYHLTEKDIQE